MVGGICCDGDSSTPQKLYSLSRRVPQANHTQKQFKFVLTNSHVVSDTKNGPQTQKQKLYTYRPSDENLMVKIKNLRDDLELNLAIEIRSLSRRVDSEASKKDLLCFQTYLSRARRGRRGYRTPEIRSHMVGEVCGSSGIVTSMRAFPKTFD